MTKLALTMIVKDDSEAKQLDQCLASFAPHVQGIFLTGTKEPQDKIKAIAKKHNATYSFFEWNGNFSDARNFSFLQVPKQYDFIVWADTDDELVNGENIRSVLKDMELRSIHWGMVNYNYAQVRDQGVADHMKPRIIKNDGGSVWEKPVHENLVYPGRHWHEYYRQIEIRHNYDPSKHLEKEQRNYALLLDEYEQDGDATDPRTLHYIGKSSLGLAMNEATNSADRKTLLEQAIHFFKQHIDKSGWDEETYVSYVQTGVALHELDRDKEAERAFAAATLLKPDWADAFWYLCLLYYDRGEWAKTVAWGEIASNKAKPETNLAVDTTLYSFRGPGTLARAYLATNQIEKATAIAKWMNDPDLLELCKKAGEIEDYVQSGIKMIYYTSQMDKSNLSRLAESMPDFVSNDPRIQELTQLARKPQHWGEKTVVIYCGRTKEEWADPSLLTGVGGSEEAVIYLGRELAKLGYEVTVFNTCGKLKGKYRGVEYRPYWEFNPRDHFKWLVVWREPLLAASAPNAKRIWAWLHDKLSDDSFTQDVIGRVEKFVFLSQWQREQCPSIPDDKALISSNGLNMADITEAVKKTPRVARSLIYASSYDRGLRYLLEAWPDILQEFPGVQLKVRYGWDMFDQLRTDPDSQAWKVEMEQLLQQPGIDHKGRVGHKELARDFVASDAWVYPTDFWEISCITAMRAQAAGAVPICTDFAALNETVQHGLKTAGVTEIGGMNAAAMLNFRSALRDYLSGKASVDREAMMHWAQEKFTWANVAKQWTEAYEG